MEIMKEYWGEKEFEWYKKTYPKKFLALQEIDTANQSLFFPPDKAEIVSGYKITPEDWVKLTHREKLFYLIEYIIILDKEYDTQIRINNEEYVTALDIFSQKCNSGICSNPPMAKMIQKMLKYDNKIPEK